MTKNNKNLDFDLDFLDEESVTETRKKASKKYFRGPFISDGVKDKIKLWSIGIVVVVGLIFFGVLFSDDSSSGSSSYNSPRSNNDPVYTDNNDMIRVGEYMCSRYHYNKATELDPDDSTLTLEKNSLVRKGNKIDQLANDIKNSYVDEYSSQWEIDEYNAKIDEHNRKLTSYNRDISSIDSKIDQYNAKVEIYNNYLVQNCTLNK